MRSEIASEFGLDPAVTHLNHGAFGCAPVVVREAQNRWRRRTESNPHRFNRVELADRVAASRIAAAEFLGIADGAALVRNVTEGVSAVLASLGLQPGDQVVLSNHTYGAVRIAVRHWARIRGVEIREASFEVGADPQQVVTAYGATVTDRTRLVIVDQITSSTAAVLPVAAIAAATGVPLLVDAAHVPGTMPPEVAGLGAAYWVGNLHKWSYTPRGTAVLWVAEEVRGSVSPQVLGWTLEAGYPEAFDLSGTGDYSGWLAIPDGLEYWEAIGGWQARDRAGTLVEEGQTLVAGQLGTSLDGLPPAPAPTMRLVRLPPGLVESEDEADRVYERLSAEHGVETAPIFFGGEGFVRLAAAPYNDLEDYERLAGALLTLTAGAHRSVASVML